MSARKHFISPDDRYEFLLDRVFLTVTTTIKKQCKLGLEHFKFNTNGVWKKKLGRSGYLMRVTWHGPVLVISIGIRWNANRELRKYYKRKLGIRRYSKIKLENDDNVLPAELRMELMRRNITLAKARVIALGLLRRRISGVVDKAKKELVNSLAEIAGKEFPEERTQYYAEKIYDLSFGLSPNVIEINYDILTTHDVAITRNAKVISRFNTVVDRYRHSDISEGYSKILKGPGAADGAGKKEIPYLIGWHDDGSVQKIYVKHWSEFGTLTRVERAFKKKNIEKALSYSNSSLRRYCEGFSEFESLINFLAEKTFKKNRDILNCSIDHSDKDRRRILKDLCFTHFRDSHLIAYEYLKKYGGINTSLLKGSCPRKVANRARELAKNRIFLRRKKRPKGFVVPDWNWILNRRPS